MKNIFTEDSRLNIVKSFLCGCSDGQTYPIIEKVFRFNVDKIKMIEDKGFEYDCCVVNDKISMIVGPRVDYKVDDPNLTIIANDILVDLDSLRSNLVEYPERFFQKKNTNNINEKCLTKLGMSTDGLIDMICNLEKCYSGVISDDYIRKIAEAIIGDVIDDIVETADNDDWNADDLRLAVGRVLCEKLNIEI